MLFEPSPKHGRTKQQSHNNASAEPKEPQESLNRSHPLSPNTSRRVSANPETGEFSIFDETYNGTNIYHGHVRTWRELTPRMKSVLIKSGEVSKKGKILK